MNLKEQVKDLKKKNKAKQIKGLDALIQLVDLLRDERGDLKELLKKDDPKQIVEAISKLENNFKDFKYPDFNKLIDNIEKIKIAPQVSVNVQYLEKVEKLLKELKEQQQTEQPFDVKGLIRLLKKPENAIAVRLTKKDADEFYNAILSVIGGGGGGGGTAITPSPTDFEGNSITVGTVRVEVTFVGTTKALSIQSASDNDGKIWIGKINVTNAGVNAVKELLPGQSYDFDYDDRHNPVYVISDTAAQTVFKFALL